MLIFSLLCSRKIGGSARLPLHLYHPEGYRCLLSDLEKTLQWIPWNLCGPPENWRGLNWKIQKSSVSGPLVGVEVATHLWKTKAKCVLALPFRGWICRSSEGGTPGPCVLPPCWAVGAAEVSSRLCVCGGVWLAGLIRFLCLYPFLFTRQRKFRLNKHLRIIE